MTVVSLINFTPLPRYDNTPWTQAKIQESSAETGPWADLETVTLSPVDADPEHPISRDFTTEDATLVNGWYRVVFRDATGDEQLPTVPIQYMDTGTAAYTPTIQQVAALIRTRTKNEQGDELDTFTSETRPTSDQVEILARRGASVLSYYVGDTVPDPLLEEASDLAALRAAMLVELSYFPEQIASNRSPYNELKALWDMAVGTPEDPGAFVRAVQGALTDEEVDVIGSAGEPAFAFPENKGGLIGWETKM